MKCGISRRAFIQFCSSLMIAAPFGLAITDKKTPEEVATELGQVIHPPVIWLAFQDCTGCTETLLRSSHPDLGDLIMNVISLEYHEKLMAGSGKQARQALDEAVKKYSGKYICVVEGSIPTRDNGVYMKLPILTPDALRDILMRFPTCGRLGSARLASGARKKALHFASQCSKWFKFIPWRLLRKPTHRSACPRA
jgi:Ni,Fe-hydrogenase I small subunit